MFNRLRNKKTDPIDAEIAKILDEMSTTDVISEAFPLMLTYVERLTEVKKKRKIPVSRDTIVLVAGNLLGILIIVAYEQNHVITSKGLGLIVRPRPN